MKKNAIGGEQFQQHTYSTDRSARLALNEWAGRAYNDSVEMAGETHWIALDADGKLFMTNARNDLRAHRWVCEVRAIDDPDGYVRDVTQRDS